MYRLVGFLLILLTFYYVAKFRNGGEDPLFPKKRVKSETLEAYKVPEYLKIDPPPDMEGTNFEKTMSHILINVLKTEKGRLLFEKMLRPAGTPIEDNDFTVSANSRVVIDNLLNIKDQNNGEGRKAVCGHKVLVDYRISNMDDLILDQGKKEIILGEGKVMPAFDNVVVGMKKGGQRRALVNKKYAYDHHQYTGKKPINETNDYRVEVKLVDIISKLDIGDDVRIFDDKISLRIPLMCGDKVSFHVKIQEVDGNVLLDTKELRRPMVLNVGDPTYPIIFSHALFSKTDKGSRFVLAKGKYMKRFKNQIFDLMDRTAINPNKTYLIEFSNVYYDLN